MCVCERERERGDGGERHSLIEVTEKESVCVCERERGNRERVCV